MKDLANKVAAKIPAKWREFGNQLDISQGDLDSFAQSRNDPQDRFTAVFEHWKRTQKHPFTWRKVLEVLYSPAMKEKKVARDILSYIRVNNYKGSTTTLCSITTV